MTTATDIPTQTEVPEGFSLTNVNGEDILVKTTLLDPVPEGNTFNFAGEDRPFTEDEMKAAGIPGRARNVALHAAEDGWVVSLTQSDPNSTIVLKALAPTSTIARHILSLQDSEDRTRFTYVSFSLRWSPVWNTDTGKYVQRFMDKDVRARSVTKHTPRYSDDTRTRFALSDGFYSDGMNLSRVRELLSQESPIAVAQRAEEAEKNARKLAQATEAYDRDALHRQSLRIALQNIIDRSQRDIDTQVKDMEDNTRRVAAGTTSFLDDPKVAAKKVQTLLSIKGTIENVLDAEGSKNVAGDGVNTLEDLVVSTIRSAAQRALNGDNALWEAMHVLAAVRPEVLLNSTYLPAGE